MSPETLALLTSRSFLVDLAIGAGIAAVVVLLGGMWLRERRTTAPIAGLALVAAFVVAGPRGIDGRLVVGLVLIAVAGSLPLAPVLRGAASLPGAWLVAGGVTTSPWVVVLAMAAIPVAGALAADLDQRHRSEALGPVLMAVTVLGLFFAVPDTEVALPLLAVGVPFGAVGWPWPRASLGPGGAFAAVAAVVWAAQVGSTGRPASFLGATAALGLLLVEPIVGRVAGRRMVQPNWVVAGGQLVVVYLASRIAAPREDVIAAAALTIGVLAVAVGVTLALFQGPLEGMRGGGGDARHP